MDAESFLNLALRVLAREADADERRTLDQELASSPERRAEFDELKLTYAAISTSAPISDAVTAQTPELPAWRRNELRTAVRQHFGPAKKERSAAWLTAMRWVFAPLGTAMCVVALVITSFANRTVEVGLYGSDLVRGDNSAIKAGDIPAAKLIAFDQDAPFSQWQDAPLAWYDRAKIWVDNEHDLLHVVQRVRHGQILVTTQPLAPTLEGQRAQIQAAVDATKN